MRINKWMKPTSCLVIRWQRHRVDGCDGERTERGCGGVGPGGVRSRCESSAEHGGWEQEGRGVGRGSAGC